LLLAILGSWVRINGAGMSCPDWPLCHGALIPALGGGVIFEWSHRLVALLEGFVVLGALAAGWNARRRIAGVTPVLAFIAGVFVVQVALGGLTVALANSPWSVVVHWGTAMLLLAGLTALAVLAVVRPRRVALPRTPLAGLIAAAAALAFAVMCAGAFVSSSGAGLACATLPACDGGSWTGVSAAQHAQMLHRVLAGALFALTTLLAYAALVGSSPRVRAAVLTGYGLVVIQALLGFANVAWALPTVLREAHAANACLVYLAFLGALVLAAVDGTAPAAARSTARAAAGAEPAR
jgi:heme A synthase